MEFVAKPQLSNRRYTETFDNLKDAVDYLNEFNNLGDEEGGLPRLKAEDFALVGKLSTPTGFYYRENKLLQMGTK